MEAFSAEDLDLIDEAFEQTWATLLKDRSRNSANDEELRRFIRDKLLTSASAGIHDVEMMRTMVLASSYLDAFIPGSRLMRSSDRR